MKKITKQTINSTFFVSIFGIISIILAYSLRIILAKNLSLEDFGLFYAVFSFVSLFLFFEGFGTSTALVKFISQFKV